MQDKVNGVHYPRIPGKACEDNVYRIQ